MKRVLALYFLCGFVFTPLALAQGGNKTQYLPSDAGANNSDFSNCSSTFTGGVYYVTCSGNVILPNGNNNWVELDATPVNLTISGDLTLGGTDINTLGSQSDLTITISGNLNPGNNGNIINANMTIAGSINAGNNTDISGGLTISGNVNLGNNSSIEGNVQVTGDLNTGTNVSITGNVDAGGNINVGQNNDITGDISGDTININGSNSTITGDVQAENDLNNSGTIIGNVNVNGNLNNNGTIEGGYVNAPCTETNSCGGGTIDVDLTCNTDNIDENTSACEPGGSGTEIHSFLLSHSGTALTCESFPVTVTACADAGCTPIALGSGSAPVSADVSLGSQTATANFASASSTTVSFDLTTPGIYTVSLSNLVGVSTTNTPQFSPSNQVTAVDTALRFSGEQTQLSGADFTLGLEAIRTDTDTGACVAAFDEPKSVDFSTTCEDPELCTESVVIENKKINEEAVEVGFSGGSASITVNYPDVGRIRLAASASGDTDNTLNGTSQAFVVKPYGIEFVTGKRLTTVEGVPVSAHADYGVLAKAGVDFELNLNAINADGSDAPSFGSEQTSEILEIKQHNLVAPLDSNNDPVNLGSLNITNTTVGAALNEDLSVTEREALTIVTNYDLSFSEVGVITLEAGLVDNDYLSAGPIPNRISQPIGRFVPDRFIQTNNELLGACGNGNFYYMGQPQGFTSQLMAVNANGTWTQNYYGDFAKGTPEFYAFTDDNPEPAPGRETDEQLARMWSFTGHLDWQQGISRWLESLNAEYSAEFNPSIIIQRRADGTPDGHYPEYTLAWQIDDGEINDSDNAAYLTKIENSVFDGVEGSAAIDSIPLYYGRLILENTFGSETEQLPVFARAEVYFDEDLEDGQPGRFVLNEDDSCTAVLKQQLSDAVSDTDLSAQRQPADNDVEQVLTSGQLFNANDILTKQFGWTQPDEQQGTFQFELLLDSTDNPLDYLQYDWDDDGDYNDNPTASGTFGIYRGSDRQIYWQEVFQ